MAGFGISKPEGDGELQLPQLTEARRRQRQLLQPTKLWGAAAVPPVPPTFSISCLKVVNTSLLLERVFWNSSNFSV